MTLLPLSSVSATAGPVTITREALEAHLIASNVAPSLETSAFMLMVCVPLTREEHARLACVVVKP